MLIQTFFTKCQDSHRVTTNASRPKQDQQLCWSFHQPQQDHTNDQWTAKTNRGTADQDTIRGRIHLSRSASLIHPGNGKRSKKNSKAWNAYWSIKFLVLDKSLSRKLRLEALSTCVFPGHLYGCQAWSLTARQRKTMEACQRRMERKVLGITLKDRISNARLQNITATVSIGQQATATKWKWGGHVARLKNGRWAQVTTMWDPYAGKRTPGRPRRRWADHFKQQLGVHWSSVARNRSVWRELGHELMNNDKV